MQNHAKLEVVVTTWVFTIQTLEISRIYELPPHLNDVIDGSTCPITVRTHFGGHG